MITTSPLTNRSWIHLLFNLSRQFARTTTYTDTTHSTFDKGYFFWSFAQEKKKKNQATPKDQIQFFPILRTVLYLTTRGVYTAKTTPAGPSLETQNTYNWNHPFSASTSHRVSNSIIIIHQVYNPLTIIKTTNWLQNIQQKHVGKRSHHHTRRSIFKYWWCTSQKIIVKTL